MKFLKLHFCFQKKLLLITNKYSNTKNVLIVKQTADKNHANNHNDKNIDNLINSSWIIWHQQK